MADTKRNPNPISQGWRDRIKEYAAFWEDLCDQKREEHNRETEFFMTNHPKREK